jgi:apolipoprotein N-acyltransferase
MILNLEKSIGWRRNTIAFLLGICATLSLAPFFIFPLIIPAYGGLFLLVSNAQNKKRAFADGWWWGWGFFISGLYWFCVALLVDADKFAWAIPLCLLGLNAIIALYPALACLIFYLLTNYKLQTTNYFKCLAFTTIWLITEYARGHLFSGFPWNLAGYAFGFSDISLQLASVFGAYGLTFFAVLLGASFTTIRSNKFFTTSIWALFFASLLWGNYRLGNAKEGEKTVAVLRLVQGNVAQSTKWDPLLKMRGIQEYISLTQSAGLEKITHVIWPESAMPEILRSHSQMTESLGKSMSYNTKLITGALRAEGNGAGFQVFNSMVMIDSSGAIIGNYDKHALVPFGEFFPLRFLIPKSLELPVGDKDFSRGAGAQTLHFAGLPSISPLICYEVIFPESVVDHKNRPELLLNITNDAWFGMSTGPHQHFEMARMRAVEQGLPLVRVANTGITAYIDEYGRVQQQLPLGTKGFFDVELRKSSLNETFYTKFLQ